MITPDKVAYWAEKKEKSNYKFRTYLKMHADPDELDAQFAELHEKYFKEYDCSKCRNCCKKFCGSIPAEDIEKDAEYLGISADDFRSWFLKENETGEGFVTKNCPCNFLKENGDCMLGDERPLSCKEFPHTNKPDRMGSLLSIIDFTSVCPVVYEIFEELKEMYRDSAKYSPRFY